MNSTSIAIVYDRINTFGGAERVLMALHETFPEAKLFTSVCNPEKAQWLKGWEVTTSFLQAVPFAKNHHQWLGWAMPLAFESLDFSGFDVIISVTSEAAKGIITKPNQVHICYCLTPTRYLWSHTYEYAGTHFAWLRRLFFTKLREWDYIASQRPDILIGISKLVAGRVQKYYRRAADEIVFPPVHIEEQKSKMKNTGEYFLVVSRLVPYKRVDLAIRACIKAREKLKIVGMGTDEKRLKEIAADNPLIEFLDFVPDEQLEAIYTHAKALICPQEEDFGIVSLEAQGYGVPVLSYAHSGVAETIMIGKTGLLFSAQTTDSLEKCIHQSSQMNWDVMAHSEHLKKFSADLFSKKMRDVVQLALERRAHHTVI